MKILYLTTDRSGRVGQTLYRPYQDGMMAAGCTTIWRKTVPLNPLPWVRDLLNGTQKDTATLDIDWVNTFDIVFTDAPWAYMVDLWDRVTIPKTMLLNDVHGDFVLQYAKHMQDAGFNDIFINYRDAITPLYKILDTRGAKRRWLPVSYDASAFYPRDVEERQKCALMFGRINSAYPFRAKVVEAMYGHPLLRIRHRPEDGTVDPGFEHESLAMELSRVRSAIIGTSRYHYTLQKMFEAAACGAAVIINNQPFDELYDLGMVHGRSCYIFDPEGNILSQIKSFVEDPLLPQVAEAGRRLVQQHHGPKARAEHLTYELEDILHGT